MFVVLLLIGVALTGVGVAGATGKIDAISLLKLDLIGNNQVDTVGGTLYSGQYDSGWAQITQITASGSGTLATLGVNIASADGNVRLGLYSSDANGVLSGLVGQSASTPTVSGWTDASISGGGSITSGHTYYDF